MYTAWLSFLFSQLRPQRERYQSSYCQHVSSSQLRQVTSGLSRWRLAKLVEVVDINIFFRLFWSTAVRTVRASCTAAVWRSAPTVRIRRCSSWPGGDGPRPSPGGERPRDDDLPSLPGQHHHRHHDGGRDRGLGQRGLPLRHQLLPLRLAAARAWQSEGKCRRKT